jgi:UDP-4-amino-4,6-dideoxy-N-acetyl-beta-L-altrosamine transaminase
VIPYGRQDVTAEDVRAVTDVLQSEFLTQGPAVPRFEDAVRAWTGAGHAVAANSATSALHIACLALGVGPGDRVWTVPNTFVASANCARYCGADVEFVDIDPVTWNLDVRQLEQRLERASRSGRLPKVVIAVHFAGQPCDMPEIAAVASRFGVTVIEDASHAIGASLGGHRIGAGMWSAITVFSFHPVKIVTTAEGGMAVTNDAALAGLMRRYRSHGITRESAEFVARPEGAWHYEQQQLGYNYRLTDLQAALGISQLARLEEYVSRRNALARRYDELLACLPVVRPVVRDDRVSAFHLYVIRLTPQTADRATVFAAMRERGIGVNVHYTPVHLQPYYRALGGCIGQCVEAERHGAQALTLPLYPAMTEEEQDRVVEALRACL